MKMFGEVETEENRILRFLDTNKQTKKLESEFWNQNSKRNYFPVSARHSSWHD